METPAGLMSATPIDDRPLIEPDRICCGEFDGRDLQDILREVFDRWRPEMPNGEFRVTVVTPELPMPPYPDGWYLEGWTVAPHTMTPPGKAAPFNYPLVAAS